MAEVTGAAANGAAPASGRRRLVACRISWVRRRLSAAEIDGRQAATFPDRRAQGKISAFGCGGVDPAPAGSTGSGTAPELSTSSHAPAPIGVAVVPPGNEHPTSAPAAHRDSVHQGVSIASVSCASTQSREPVGLNRFRAKPTPHRKRSSSALEDVPHASVFP